MRIAVHLPENNPQKGGAFAFQQAILEGLLALAPASRHEFLVYSTDDSLANELPRNVSFVRLRRGFVSSAGERASSFAADIQDRYIRKRVVRPAAWFERSLRRHRVEAAWFTVPQFLECDVPYVFTVWDLQHLVQPWFPEVSARGEWLLRDHFYRRTILRATRTIVANQAARDEIVRFFGVPDERLLLLPHPLRRLPDRSSGLDVRRKYSLPERFLFYPAQFWPHKNHVNLLHALKLLRDRGMEISLVLCGADHGNEPHLRSVAQSLGLASQVHFLGFIPAAELEAFYRAAFALAFVSFFGPENLPPLEAFAAGCPVISSAYAGSSEQLGDAALLVDPRKPSEIADAVARLANDRELRETLIRRGSERAGAWTGEAYVAKVLEFFDEFETIRRCWPAG